MVYNDTTGVLSKSLPKHLPVGLLDLHTTSLSSLDSWLYAADGCHAQTKVAFQHLSNMTVVRFINMTSRNPEFCELLN